MPKYNQPRKTWKYTKDFKIKAIKLSYQEGIQVKEINGVKSMGSDSIEN